MFFELEGKTYRIKFYRTGMTTVAELFEVTKTVDDLGDDTAMSSLGIYGIARPHHTDRFEKKVGRKVALAHLLVALSDHEDEDGNLVESVGPIVLDRADRAMIWAKYFESHKK